MDLIPAIGKLAQYIISYFDTGFRDIRTIIHNYHKKTDASGSAEFSKRGKNFFQKTDQQSSCPENALLGTPF